MTKNNYVNLRAQQTVVVIHDINGCYILFKCHRAMTSKNVIFLIQGKN